MLSITITARFRGPEHLFNITKHSSASHWPGLPLPHSVLQHLHHHSNSCLFISRPSLHLSALTSFSLFTHVYLELYLAIFRDHIRRKQWENEKEPSLGFREFEARSQDHRYRGETQHGIPNQHRNTVSPQFSGRESAEGSPIYHRSPFRSSVDYYLEAITVLQVWRRR